MKNKSGMVFNISRLTQLKWVVVFRVILGLSLFLKGIQFIQDKSVIRKVFSESLILQEYFWLQTLIPWLNILCGFFIVIGVFTRIMTIIQIPIIIGAIIFVNSKHGAFEGESDLALSIVILVLLLFFLFVGGGDFTWDQVLRKEDKSSHVND
jgi:uncharacterized membrane protein YphA (DoxX/SURF4 family)